MPTAPLARPFSPSSPMASSCAAETTASSLEADSPFSPAAEAPAPLPAATAACLRVLEALGQRRLERPAATSAREDDPLASFLSFSEMHQLLQDASALDTPAKYAHMLHAMCVLADRRLEETARRWREAKTGAPLSSSSALKTKKRRLTVDPDAVKREEAPEDRGVAGDPVLFEDSMTRGDSESAAGSARAEGDTAQGDEGEDRDGSQGDSAASDEEEGDRDEGDADRESGSDPAEKRHEMAAHVAGLLLGTLESLRRPPALGADDFLDTVTHVLTRVLYAHQPVVASAAPSDERPDASNKAERPQHSDFSSSCSSSFSSSGCSFSSVVECRQAWRRGVIRRFETIDRLLSQSSSFFSANNPAARATSSADASSLAATASGEERCRRAMRLVRRWAAFLLELEKIRRQAVDRIRATSEEAQGLTHMLFLPQETAPAEKHKKRKPRGEVVVAGFNDAAQEGEEQAASEEQRIEARIVATAQLLRLPALPPFAFPTNASVVEARGKFERCLARWREERARRKQQEEEAMKKVSAAALIVSYVTARMREQEDASSALAAALPGSSQALAALMRQRSIAHAFYLLGLNPQTATVPMVEAVKKKWRVLLHPDKFHSVPHLLHQATEAFKGFQLAVEEAIRAIQQRRVDPGWAQPPPPPDPSAAASPLAAGASPLSAPGPGKSPAPPGGPGGAAPSSAPPSPASPCPLPTRQYFPEFSIEVAPRRKALGAFLVYVSAAGAGADPAFSEITEVRVYIHRPVLGGPPGSLTPSPEALSGVITRKVSLVGSKREEERAVEEKIEVVDVVQPLCLGEERRYWVGVQVEGRKKDFSLIRWSPVLLRLALPPAVDAAEDLSRPWSSGASRRDEGAQAAAEARALLAFLTSFSEASFLDGRMRGKVQESINSLKRLMRHISKKKMKKGAEGAGAYGVGTLPHELLVEYLATAKEGRELLQQCLEKGKAWADRTQ
ncbi:hypothetical protein BESB_079450 [Besnoitia besnoiti]|uniref:DnaJ domain-containing protein n=1 Tax=Besnoitia besnoiti TaxID=94643 RepID=A0A2A9M703_BESBE|nr:hypothetical protein BESB_079450 [Besnoitia besnoiti]PFH33729.1 hypothetical protein BESB_079450 [Besnoitia besnoiti]